MRKTEKFKVSGSNPLWQIYRTVPFWKVFKNTLVIVAGRYLPFMSLKKWVFHKLLHMEIGKNTAIAFMAMMDILYPEKIHIGENTVIGYNTTILTHEYLVEEYRLGEVHIGDHVMIGANTTILPGITIGDHAVVGAGSVVTRDVPPYAFVAGNPIRLIKMRDKV